MQIQVKNTLIATKPNCNFTGETSLVEIRSDGSDWSSHETIAYEIHSVPLRLKDGGREMKREEESKVLKGCAFPRQKFQSRTFVNQSTFN